MAYEKSPSDAATNAIVAPAYVTVPGTVAGFPADPAYASSPAGTVASGDHLLDTGGADILTDGSGNQLTNG